MTALPLRDFTAAEQDRLAAIEAAPAAAESLREVVAARLYVTDGGEGLDHPVLARAAHQRYLRLADAAIAVLRGPSSDAERAVERADIRDDRGYYRGKVGTPAEHRTVGDYRAWCYDCGEWCYPSAPCGEPKCCTTVAGD